jgi:ubiquitin C-terminal hydrolase
MRKDTSAFDYNGEDIQFSKLFAGESPAESKGFSYKPIGMINHMGTLMGGHYNAEVFHPLIKKWYIFDDEACHERDGPHFSPMTYIIVFRSA